ncbi:MAG TPA: bile acid:sodium symporter family protein [Candidatus Limnocylindria bacterium]|nr:bile acid:sodium symporter family protein [Candidatus Limnocylindria bacterium]
MRTFYLKNWFVLSLPLVVALAWLVPELGASGGWLQSQVTTKVGVAIIFFFQGLTIPTSALHHGLKNWRLHLIVQLFIFGLFPLLGMVFDHLAGDYMPRDLRLGFLFLSVLPSTISTSPVLTSMAGGNTVGAIFNAVLSNLLGIVLTPLWASWLMKTSGHKRPLGPVIAEVVLYLFVPLLIGQVARLRLHALADARRKILGNMNSGLVLFIVFAAFCNSVKTHVWRMHGWGVTLGAMAGVLVLFGVATALAELLAWAFRLNRGDQIVAVFAGPHKTLASGVPMAKVIFEQHPGLGLILLPIMFYHPLQLFVCGMMAHRMARKHGQEGGSPNAHEAGKK